MDQPERTDEAEAPLGHVPANELTDAMDEREEQAQKDLEEIGDLAAAVLESVPGFRGTEDEGLEGMVESGKAKMRALLADDEDTPEDAQEQCGHAIRDMIEVEVRTAFQPMWPDDPPEYPGDEQVGEVAGIRYRTGPEIADALAAAIQEAETIAFDGQNKGQGYKYASGSAIAVYARELLAKHGLALRRIRHEVVDEHSLLWVRCLYQLRHRPSRQTDPPEWFPVPLVSGHGRSLDKAVGAALSFADKYHRQGVLGLDWKGEDDVDGRVEQKQNNRGGRQPQQQQQQRMSPKVTREAQQPANKPPPPKGGNNPQYQERVQAARTALQNSRVKQNSAIRWATGLHDLTQWKPGFAPASVYIAVTDFCVLYRKRNEETGLKIDSHTQYLAEIADEDQEAIWREGQPGDRANTFDKTIPPNK